MNGLIYWKGISMREIKVSIIIPVYNVERYLNQCLDSVVNQTLKEMEIIVINDGSTDNSLEIIKKYQNLYDLITVIDKKNEGVSIARNLGLEIAKGEYIYFLDSDDYIELNMLEKMYHIAKREDADIVQCGIEIFENNTENKISLYYGQEENLTILSKEEAVKKYLRYQIPGYSVNKIVKRNLIEDLNIRFPRISCFEDMLPTLQIFIGANKVVLLREALYHYRQTPGSLSKTIDEKKVLMYINEVKSCLDLVYKELEELEFTNEIQCFKVINYLNAINWYIKCFECDRKKIKKNYQEYFEKLQIDYHTMKVLKLKELKRNYKIIFILEKLNLYRLFIKFGIF